MPEEKDRFGDKLREAERGREDDYFAKRDRELIKKLREDKGAEAEIEAKEESRGRCPRCGTKLSQRVLERTAVDECSACGGVWLDRGELEALVRAQPDNNWLVALLRSSIRMR